MEVTHMKEKAHFNVAKTNWINFLRQMAGFP